MYVVDQVLKSHWDWCLPVKVDVISKALSVNLLKLPTGEDQYVNLSGISKLDDTGCRVIYYNSSESLNRQRFAIAHGLGHHMLGHINSKADCFREGSSTFNSENKDVQELHANHFAVRILMPMDAIKTLLFVKGIANISELAKRFSVSEAAMHYRLQGLGYLTL